MKQTLFTRITLYAFIILFLSVSYSFSNSFSERLFNHLFKKPEPTSELFHKNTNNFLKALRACTTTCDTTTCGCLPDIVANSTLTATSTNSTTGYWLAISPDGTKLVQLDNFVAGSAKITGFNPNTGQLDSSSTSLLTSGALKATWAPSSCLAVGLSNGKINLYPDGNASALQVITPPGNDSVGFLTYSCTGLLAMGTQQSNTSNATLYIYDTSTTTPTLKTSTSLGTGATNNNFSIRSLSFSPDSNYIAVTGANQPSLFSFNTGTFKIYSYNQNNTLQLTSIFSTTLPTTQNDSVVSWRPLVDATHNGISYLALGTFSENGGTGTLTLYKFDTTTVPPTVTPIQTIPFLPIDGGPETIAWSPDGRYFAVDLSTTNFAIYKFDPTCSPVATQVATGNSGGSGADLEMLVWSSNCKYIVGIADSNNGSTKAFSIPRIEAPTATLSPANISTTANSTSSATLTITSGACSRDPVLTITATVNGIPTSTVITSSPTDIQLTTGTLNVTSTSTTNYTFAYTPHSGVSSVNDSFNYSVKQSDTGTGCGTKNCGCATGQVNIAVNSPLLKIEKTSSSFTEGSTGTYTITVTNTGTASTSDTITVTDILPTGLTYISASGSDWTVTPNSDNTQITATTNTVLAQNGNSSFSFNVAIGAIPSGSVSNTATVSGGGDGTASVTTTTPVTAGSVLSIAKSASPTMYVGTQGGSYTITLTNSGHAAAPAEIIVTDALPTGFTLSAKQPASTGWDIVKSQDLKSFTATSTAQVLANNGTLSFTLNVDVDAAQAGVVTTNTAIGTASSLATPTAQVVSTVNPVSALNITKAATGPFIVGQQATYTITLTNNGPSDTQGQLIITDILPTGISFHSVTVTSTNTNTLNFSTPEEGYHGAIYFISTDSLASGRSVTLTITVNVTEAATAGATTTNIAQTTISPIGTTPASSIPATSTTSATATALINPSAGLKLTKTVNQATINPGENLVYTFTVTNSGPNTATNSVVTDTDLPANYNFTVTSVSPANSSITATPGSGNTLGTLSWTIPSLPFNDTAVLIVSGPAPANAGPLTNTATLTSSQFNPNPSSSTTAQASTNVNPTSALNITKAAIGQFNVGNQASYTLTLTNSGPDATQGTLVISDNLPTGITFQSLTTSGSSITFTQPLIGDAGTIQFISNDSLASGGSVTLTITVNITAAATASATATNTAITTLTPQGTSPASFIPPTSITTARAFSVILRPNLVVTKQVGANPFVPNSPDILIVGNPGGSYTITVTNQDDGSGTIAATTAPFTLTDTLPTGFTLASLQPTNAGWSLNSQNGQDFTATYTPSLAVEASAELTVYVAIDSSAAQAITTNSAYIAGGSTSSAIATITPTGTVAGVVFNDTNGNGVQNTGEAGISGIQVQLIDTATMAILATQLSGTDGSYSFTNTPLGTYTIAVPTPPTNTIATAGTTKTLIVGANLTSSANFGYQPVGTVSGVAFIDSNANGTFQSNEPTIGNVTVKLIKNSQVIQTATTDSNGNYSFTEVPTDNYTVEVTTPEGLIPTTMLTKAIVVSQGGAATASFGFTQPSFISGVVFVDLNGNRIYTTNEPVLISATVQLKDLASGTTVATITTDAQGSYSFKIQNPGAYQVALIVPAGYTSSTLNQVPVTVTLGNSATASFGVQRQNTVTGIVFNDLDGNGAQTKGEFGLVGVTVQLVDTAGNVVATTSTNQNGQYNFDQVAPGTYTIQADAPNNFIPQLLQKTVVVTTASGATANLGFQQKGTISGVTFYDFNGNGKFDAQANALGGVTVQLIDNTGAVVQTVVSNIANGVYIFNNVTAGTYTINALTPPGFKATTSTSQQATLANGAALALNFGYQAVSIISGFAFNDINGDGIQESNEPGLSGVTIQLLNNGTVIGTTKSLANGVYSFASVPAGTYTVQAKTPAGFIPTTSTKLSVTNTTVVQANFGFKQSSTLSGVAFNDLNGTGEFIAGCPGLNNLTVSLFNSAGQLVQTTVTDAQGNYSFDQLAPGTYTVLIQTPSGYTATTATRVQFTVTQSQIITANFGFKLVKPLCAIKPKKTSALTQALFTKYCPCIIKTVKNRGL